MGFASMRQAAIECSGGELIMSIDDDCTAAEGAIRHMVERFASDRTIGIVGGHIINIGFSRGGAFKGRGRIVVNGAYEQVCSIEDAEVFGSANMSIRREAFDVVGGYDLFFSGGMEEADLTLSIRSKGYRVVYDPGVRIKHFHSPSKFRSRWRNLDVMRLYLFFKHRMPGSLKEWGQFLGREFALAVRDSATILRQARSGEQAAHDAETGDRLDLARVVKRNASSLVHLVSGHSKMVLARLAIPYLIIRACAAHKALDAREPAAKDAGAV